MMIKLRCRAYDLRFDEEFAKLVLNALNQLLDSNSSKKALRVFNELVQFNDSQLSVEGKLYFHVLFLESFCKWEHMCFNR